MNKNLNRFLIFLIAFTICLFSIGYSVLESSLRISGEVNYRADAEVRVTDFVAKDVPSNMTIQYSEFSKHEVKLGFTPTNADASVTFEVTVKNNSPYTFVISNIENSNINTSYELENYKLGDLIGKKESVTFNITFKHNTSLLDAQAVLLNFTFERPSAEMLIYDNTKSKSKCIDVKCALDELYQKLR